MPRWARRCGGKAVISSSRKRIRPERMGRSPVMLSMIVVRPAPLRPTRATTSSVSTAIETPRRTCAGPRKVLRSSTSRSTGRAQSGGQRSAEQDARDILVGADLIGRAIGKEGPLMHHHDAVGIAEHDVHVVLDDDGGD